MSISLLPKTPQIAVFAETTTNYDFPVFPEDFAYYLMKDNKTLIMVSAVKNINQSFKFDISTNKLHKYSTKGKLDFIISSITKDCGFS